MMYEHLFEQFIEAINGLRILFTEIKNNLDNFPVFSCNDEFHCNFFVNAHKLEI